MKAQVIHLTMFVFIVFITLFQSVTIYAQSEVTPLSSEKQSANLTKALPPWVEKSIELSRYIKNNKLVVNDAEAERFQALIDKAEGEEKLNLLYYQVLEATFYVYKDMMRKAKPSYVVEIEKQNSSEHKKYLEIMEIFSNFYIGGSSEEPLKRLKQIALNEKLDMKARARAYMMLGYSHGLIRETEEIIDVLKKVKALIGINEVDAFFKAELLDFEGYTRMISNDYEKAMELRHERLELARDLGLMVSGDSYVYHVARILMEKGVSSVSSEINALNNEVAELTGKDRSIFNASYLCGVNYLRLAINNTALECLSRAELYLSAAKDRAIYLDYYLSIAHARNNDASKARYYYERVQGNPKLKTVNTIQRDMPVAQAELYRVEGFYEDAFSLQRDYTNQLLIRKTNELGDVANKLREYAEEQSTIQNERSNLMALNSTLKDEIITKQRVVTSVSFGVAFIALLSCAGLFLLTRKLRKARVDAEAANKSKSEFLAKMSHEIRTPMNGILGMTEVLLNSTLSKKQRSYANTVYKSGASLMGILNDILDFSKIEAGKMELDPIPFDLEVAVTDVITLMEQTARDKNLDCKVDYKQSLPKQFIGDEGRIRQVITNLISNAIKFTEEGFVAIEVDGIESFGSEKVQLKITIKDTGIGITDDQADKIFDGFTQAEGSTTRRFGGTGLGLTISQQLVQAMDGKIGVDSEIGRGSEFWIELELPLAKRETERGDTNAIANSTATVAKQAKPKIEASTLAPVPQQKIERAQPKLQKNIKALIVDSSDNSLKKMRKICADNNIDVICKKNASDTTSTLRNAYEAGDPYDVVILDYHLPGTNGAAIAKSIYQDTSVGNLKVILISKMDITHYAPRLCKIGITSVLTKPVNDADLMESILTALSNRNITALKSMSQAPTVAKVNQASSLPSSNDSSRQSILPENKLSFEDALTEKALMERRGRLTVLIVDDNRTNRVVLSNFVDTDRFDVVTAENGKEAWKLSKKTRFDMIFMDISMPVMDGVKATLLIREDEDNPNYETPIIACTAHALKGDRSRFTAVGMNDYISKPIQKFALDKITEKWSKKKRKAA